LIFRHKKDGGWLELNWANGYGCSRRCNVCLKEIILFTKPQILRRPHLLKEMKDVVIEGLTKWEANRLKDYIK